MKTTKIDAVDLAEHNRLREKLRFSGAINEVQAALIRLFELDVSEKTAFDDSTLRMLLTIRWAPDGLIRAKDISWQLKLSTSHISRLIDRAESAGLVERRAHPSDRRAHHIALTALGEQEIDGYIPHAANLLDEAIFQGLSEDEVAVLLALLERIAGQAHSMIKKREG